jgi:hypothetical protein
MNFTERKEDLTAWGINFLTIWESNVSQQFKKEVIHTHYGQCITSTDGVLGLKLMLGASEYQQDINPTGSEEGTEVVDIPLLNLSTITIGRILSGYGGYRVNCRSNEDMVVSGYAGNGNAICYHLVIRKVNNEHSGISS